jgi:16S rRNA (guanine527-N7)-methyltransferase
MEQADGLASLLKTSSAEIGVRLREDQIKQFMTYLDQLRDWNRLVNLTGITVDHEIIIKHFVDSLAGLRVEEIRDGARLLDIGTGAGFPGIPLKIARQDLNLTLIESVQKKIAFLHFLVGLLRLERISIFHGTLERFLTERSSSPFDYITTRALRPDVILRNGLQLLSAGGKVILYLTQPFTSSELDKSWSLVNEYRFNLPEGFGQRVISLLSPIRDSATDVPRGTPIPTC